MTDNLSKEDRELVETYRSGVTFPSTVITLIGIIDKLAPKLPDLVTGWEAVHDMYIRPEARYLDTSSNITYCFINKKLSYINGAERQPETSRQSVEVLCRKIWRKVA